MQVRLGLGAKAERGTRNSPRFQVVAQLGWQPAARSLIAAPRGLDVRAANLSILRLRTEGK
jgi:hypothetical protein